MKFHDTLTRQPIERLVGYARNARTHSDEQIAQIMASIREWGFTNPCLITPDGTIVAGHGRVLAANRLGLKEVPCIVAEGWTEAQMRAYVIADNKLALNAGWDSELLAIELDDLRLEDFDLDLLGFSANELDDLLRGEETTTEGQADDDEVPELPEAPVSKAGDVWILSHHRLLCGDATDRDSYDRVLNGSPVDLIWTDPPYNVNYANSLKDKLRGKDRPILNDNLGEDFQGFLLAALEPMLSHCSGAAYIAMSSSELDTLQSAFRLAGGHWSTFIIWAKHTFTLGRSDYQRQYEPVLYGWPEGIQRHWCGDRDQGDVWQIKKPVKNDLHPTMKPVELVERAIRNSSRPGDRVLDPFAGSGTTLIAAEKSGRIARLIELDPKYIDVIVKRWELFTGRTAMLETTGESFAGDQLA
jgi:DNA modification methylase